MPRPNATRTLRSESNLARRIAYERDQRGWTYEGTAKRLTDAGCAIQASAIYKIEKADPPRRISVDELVAFAAIFKTSVEQLLMPPELVEVQHVQALFEAWDHTRELAVAANENEKATRERLRLYVEGRPDLSEHLRKFVRASVDKWAPERGEGITAYWMGSMTGDDKWWVALEAAVEAGVDAERAKWEAEHSG